MVDVDMSVIESEKDRSLDQFFTNPNIANKCIADSLIFLKHLGYLPQNLVFLEPSAGDGAFVSAIEKQSLDLFSDINLFKTLLEDSLYTQNNKIIALDIDPKSKNIKKNDFLKNDLRQTEKVNNILFFQNLNFDIPVLPHRNNIVVVGNPPFGKRAKIAIEFINRAFDYSDTVAFILPLMFQKYSAQKQVNGNAKLIYDQKLPKNSFLFKGKPYDVRCCFQIWTLKDSKQKDLRITNTPQIHHPYFQMWQYNNTKQAEKYFNKDKYSWDFAVPRQGYKNYNKRETDPKNLNKNTQWIFFKASSKEILNNLYKIDFEKLSKKNTSIPGFGKADVIQEFNYLFPNYSSVESNTSTVTQKFQLGEPRANFA